MNNEKAEWAKLNPHRIRITQKNYRIKNKDTIKENRKISTKRYYEKNKEKILVDTHQYTKTERHYALRKRLWRK